MIIAGIIFRKWFKSADESKKFLNKDKQTSLINFDQKASFIKNFVIFYISCFTAV